MVNKDSIGFSNFTNFARGFEQYVPSKERLVDVSLLYLVQNAFGYESISVSYHPLGAFRSIEIVGNCDVNRVKSSYINDFQKKDPYAAYITKTCKKDPKTTTLQSSKAFNHNYYTHEYYQFINTFGAAYALTVPLGDYRLTVYRNIGDRDFSNNEHEAMELLGELLKQKLSSEIQRSSIADAYMAENNALDSIGIGVLTFTSKYQIVNCNETGINLICNLTQTDFLSCACKTLHNIALKDGVEKRNRSNTPSIWLKLNNHIIVVDEKNSSSEKQYTMTIYSCEGNHSKNIDSGLLIRQYGLSEREIEIAILLVNGKSYQEIGDTLYISLNTVRTHVSNMYRKLGIDNKKLLSGIIQSL